MQKVTKTTKSIWRRSRWLWIIGLAVMAACPLIFNRTSISARTAFSARRGPLLISVLEGGSIEALESQIIRSEIEKETKILHIIEEGYQVTEEDVANGLILVELDTSDVKERITTQEMDFQATLANLTEALKEKEVQENRNFSEIKTASLDAKFALMDFKKYLGEQAAVQILDQVNLNEQSVAQMVVRNQDASAAVQDRLLQQLLIPDTSDPKQDPNSLLSLNNGSISGVAKSPPAMDMMDSLLPEIKDYNVDFSIFASDDKEDLLGDGEARQQLRKLKDDLLIAQAEFTLAKKAYEGAVRLAKEDYVTPNELQQRKITFDKSDNAVQAARANLELFRTYDLQKTAEQFLLNYEKALLELLRVKSDALAELSDKIADTRWSTRRYNIQKDRLARLNRQLGKCVIRAECLGLVVYGDGKEQWDRNEIIREGATVRERQAIITIPDMSKMALTVRIHESQVKRVQTGQLVRISVDAEAEKQLTGIVRRVAVLPDSENQLFNPDQKVYKTTITIDGIHTWLKPGMTAKAEIIVQELEDVVYVPLQAIIPNRKGHACFVRNGAEHELRTVDIVDYNNRFAAIQSGLSEGELVYLHIPKGVTLNDEYVNPSDADGSFTNQVRAASLLTHKQKGK